MQSGEPEVPSCNGGADPAGVRSGQGMVQVWTPRPPVEAFAAACRAVQASGAAPTRALETAPAGLTYVWRTDLGGAVQQKDVDGDAYWRLVSGADTSTQVVRAAFVRADESVVVEYGPAPA